MEKLFRNPLHIGRFRNCPCPCGSGKKVKKCHGDQYALPQDEAKAIAQILVDKQKVNLISKGQ